MISLIDILWYRRTGSGMIALKVFGLYKFHLNSSLYFDVTWFI